MEHTLGYINKTADSERKYISILAFIVYLISPILSLPFIFFSILKKERFGLFVLSLFGGILSYSIVPNWALDLSRYYLLYERISQYGYEGFLEVINQHNDYVFFFIYYVFSLTGMHFQFMLFILSSLSFYTVLLVFDVLIKKQSLRKGEYSLLMLSFILSLPIMSSLSVSRFSLAFVFFVLFTYYQLIGKRVISYTVLAIACFTHFAFLVYIPFLLLFTLFVNRRKIKVVVVLMVLFSFLFTASGILASVAPSIPIIGEKITNYLTLYQETQLPLLSVSLILPVVFSIVFYFKFADKIPVDIMRIFLATLFVVLITLPLNVIIYDRYIQVFKPIMVMAIMFTVPYLSRAKDRFLFKLLILGCMIPFVLYYLLTIYGIYGANLSGFMSAGKLLLVSIFSTNYTHFDFF